MKIGNVLGMVRKKENGKKEKKRKEKENSFAKQISLKESFVHYTDGSCDVRRMTRRFAPLKHKRGCLVSSMNMSRLFQYHSKKLRRQP